VSARLELVCKFATDEASPAYDDDFHSWAPRKEGALSRGIFSTALS
jgi:hypothetical protein